MDSTVKAVPRKRLVVGWRQEERRRTEIVKRQRTFPTPIAAKRER